LRSAIWPWVRALFACRHTERPVRIRAWRIP